VSHADRDAEPAKATTRPSRSRHQDVGLAAGPILAAATALALPESYLDSAGDVLPFGAAGRATAALAAWMAVWWLSEAIPIYATALLPLAVLPLLGAASMMQAAAPYAHELIFLFMGGFLIALAMERWGLHRRVALTVLRFVGDRPTRVVGGFMLVTALLSMWVSNTATAIMLLPVATSVIGLVARQYGAASAEEAITDPASPLRNFALCLLLGIAYGASIGGVGTPIGTPPNVLVLSFMKSHLGREISFVRWMAMAIPLVVIFLPLAWWILTRLIYPIRFSHIEGGGALVRQKLHELGPIGHAERVVMAVFALTGAAWIARPLLQSVSLGGTKPLAGLSDSGIAMLAAMILFVVPASRKPHQFVLDWETALKLPWGILILFGGGLSLAAAIQANGVGELVASQVAGLAGTPAWMVVLAVVTLIVFLTELTSNTATAATFVPILAALAVGLGIEPVLLVVPAALAASCAFMLPVATPPNAVVFGSGLVRIPEMSRAGFWLNWIGIALISALAYTLLLPMLGS
jgi:sodium-dependent dicarboxylate transporter 2/3/5